MDGCIERDVIDVYPPREIECTAGDLEMAISILEEYIKIKEKLSPGDKVYKTKDYLYYKDLESAPAGEFRRFPLDFKVYAYPGSKLVIDAEGFGNHKVGLAVRIIREQRIQQAQVNGCLLGFREYYQRQTGCSVVSALLFTENATEMFGTIAKRWLR